MSNVGPFHSINESRKAAPRYHTNDACPMALQIPADDLRQGSGGYYVCERCREMSEQEELEREAAELTLSAEGASVGRATGDQASENEIDGGARP